MDTLVTSMTHCKEHFDYKQVESLKEFHDLNPDHFLY